MAERPRDDGVAAQAVAATATDAPASAAAGTRRAGAKVASDKPAPARLSLSIQLGDGVDAPPADRARLRRWVRAALERDASLTLRFVGEDEGRALNRDFRGRDYATNVLTFEYGEDPDTGAIGGDVVVCVPVVHAEAAAQRKAFEDHLAHLVIHGVLHAQGWDHQDDASAEAMEAREAALLGRFGVPDPYHES